MGMQIVTKSYVEEIVEYWHEFDYESQPGCGFCFAVNEAGTPIDWITKGPLANVNPYGYRNYLACQTGTVGGKKVIDRGINKHHRTYRHPAEGKCDCGHVLALEAFTNTCERCGRDYNFAGQRLAPRSQWGYDTNESESDILSIGHHIG